MLRCRQYLPIFLVVGALMMASQARADEPKPAGKRLSACRVYLAAAVVVAVASNHYREPIREYFRYWQADSFAARVEASATQEKPQGLSLSDFLSLADYLLDESDHYGRPGAEHVVRRSNAIQIDPLDGQALMRVLKLDDATTGGAVGRKAQQLGFPLAVGSDGDQGLALADLLGAGRHTRSFAEVLAVGIKHQYSLALKQSIGSENESFPTLASLAKERCDTINRARLEIQQERASAAAALARANRTYVVGGQSNTSEGIDSINAMRSQRGLGPLVLDPAISSNCVVAASSRGGSFQGLDLSKGGKAGMYENYSPAGFGTDFSAALKSSYISSAILDPSADTVGFATVGGKTVLQVNPAPGSRMAPVQNYGQRQGTPRTSRNRLLRR